jgi:hypothetical protein
MCGRTWAVVSVLLTMTGCIIHRDATNDFDVHKTGIYDKEFEVVEDVHLHGVGREEYENELLTGYERDSFFIPVAINSTTIASGTRFKVTRVSYHEWQPSYSTYFTYVTFLNGPYAGMEAREHVLWWSPRRDSTPTRKVVEVSKLNR